MCEFDWRDQPLIVDLNADLTPAVYTALRVCLALYSCSPLLPL
jgi:hypothetical protein